MDRINGGSYQQTFEIDSSSCNGPHEPETTNIRSTKEKLLEAEDEDITRWGQVKKHT
jgi:hypothetical protein